jgi:DNA topoisomerase-2
MTKQITEKYKKLDEISHVLLRPARYIGAITAHEEKDYIYSESNHKMVEENITYIPALLKVFDEVLSNSADFSKTEDGKHLTEIKVEVDRLTGELSVYDNGGITVVKHPEHDQWIPELIFELRSGSNFDDDNIDNDFNTGQNGEGASLTSIFSTEFKVETADGKHRFHQIHSDNSRNKTEPKITKSPLKFTKITWMPDYDKLNLSGLDIDNYKILHKRVIDLSACNPNLNVYFNNKLIKINNFEEYIKLYVDDILYVDNDNWKVGITQSSDGFKHISFVNSTRTKIGGVHVEYISNQIILKLREYFKKKHKVDIKPSDIKNHFFIFIDAKIKKPRYDSQTKDNLITEVKNFGTSIEITDKFIKSLLSSEIVKSILDWVAAKDQAQLNADLRKHNKVIDKANPKLVENFHDASTKIRTDAMLFLTEGLSATSGILSGRSPKTMGIFSLGGKPINVTSKDLKEILNNKEFKNILTITGLSFGVKVNSILDLRFSRIIISTDQDLDGYNIRALLINAFYTFWPELFDLNVICVLNTPIVKVTHKKKVISFYNVEEFEKWQTKYKTDNYTSKYFKGLGTSSSKEWKEYLENIESNLDVIKSEGLIDKDILNLQFSKERGMADNRKQWLNLE